MELKRGNTVQSVRFDDSCWRFKNQKALEQNINNKAKHYDLWKAILKQLDGMPTLRKFVSK